MARRFTLEEARSVLPEVARLLRRVVELKAEYDQAESALRDIADRVTRMGGMTVDRPHALDARNRREAAAAGLRDAIERVQQYGCLIKDLNTGLVDFPTLYRGQEVYLCWRLGEETITHWHGVEEGFAGRKPIDDDFVEHHQGEAAN